MYMFVQNSCQFILNAKNVVNANKKLQNMFGLLQKCNLPELISYKIISQ